MGETAGKACRRGSSVRAASSQAQGGWASAAETSEGGTGEGEGGGGGGDSVAMPACTCGGPGAAAGGGRGGARGRAARSGRHGGQYCARQPLHAVWCWRKTNGVSQTAHLAPEVVSVLSARRCTIAVASHAGQVTLRARPRKCSGEAAGRHAELAAVWRFGWAIAGAEGSGKGTEPR